MRKSRQKSAYHWVIMSFVMLLPIVSLLLMYLAKDLDIFNEIYQELNSFYIVVLNNSFFDWYKTLVSYVGIDIEALFGEGYIFGLTACYYPLYALMVCVLDLIYDCFAFIPEFFHDFLHKLGGEKE